jgi:hypothetical protein
MTFIIIALVLILIILLTIIFCFLYIKNKASAFSETWFGTSDLFEGLKQQKQELEAEPKVPYGMDNLLLPEINRDFPNMNIDEMKKIAEESLLNFFSSIQTGNLTKPPMCSSGLRDKISNLIAHNRKTKISFDNLNIHKTVINQYVKNGSVCKMIFQSALGYKEITPKDSNIKEERYNTEFVYIYDTNGLHGNESISLKCPNCGAPIKGLGHKVCPYCKAGLIDLAPKTWKLTDINKA